MNKQFSQYLDFVRITAASLVLLAHLPLLPAHTGHSSVMIFFVLSGYVITYVAREKEFTLLEFSISRISRVYSVVIPAIVLTTLVDVFVLRVTPLYHAAELRSSIPAYQYAGFAKYMIMSLLFGNQAWGLRESLFSNSAYWSMCFEVYYYALFAAMVYFRGAPRIASLKRCTYGDWARAIVGVSYLVARCRDLFSSPSHLNVAIDRKSCFRCYDRSHGLRSEY